MILTFPQSLLIINCIILVSFLAAYLLLKYRGRKRRKYLKHKQDCVAAQYQQVIPPSSPSTNEEEDAAVTRMRSMSTFTLTSPDNKSEKMIAVEWLHQYQQRPVKIKFGVGLEGKVHVENRKGDRLRTITISTVSAMLLEITEDPVEEPMVLLRIHKEHDLVLIFATILHRHRFINVLTTYLASHGKELVITPTTHQQIFATAETKEKRQRRLERFFKIAYIRVRL